MAAGAVLWVGMGREGEGEEQKRLRYYIKELESRLAKIEPGQDALVSCQPQLGFEKQYLRSSTGFSLWQVWRVK
jgi:hypothetical protein